MKCPFLKDPHSGPKVVKAWGIIGWCRLRKAEVTLGFCRNKCKEANDVKCEGCGKSYKAIELAGGTSYKYHDGKHNRYPMLCQSCRDNWKHVKSRLEMRHKRSKGLAGFRR